MVTGTADRRATVVALVREAGFAAALVVRTVDLVSNTSQIATSSRSSSECVPSGPRRFGVSLLRRLGVSCVARQPEHYKVAGGGKTIMAYVNETDGVDRSEAILWAAPTGPLPAPPIDTKAQLLPIGDLQWLDAERLFLRLLHTVRPVQYAKLFGVPGQTQGGIDAYARLPLDLTDDEAGGRNYITLQSRRVKSLS